MKFWNCRGCLDISSVSVMMMFVDEWKWFGVWECCFWQELCGPNNLANYLLIVSAGQVRRMFSERNIKKLGRVWSMVSVLIGWLISCCWLSRLPQLIDWLLIGQTVFAWFPQHKDLFFGGSGIKIFVDVVIVNLYWR